MSKFYSVRFEVDDKVTPDQLHEFLCQTIYATSNGSTLLAMEMFQQADPIIDVGDPTQD